MVEFDNNFQGDTNRVLLRGWLKTPIRLDHQTEGSPIYSTKIRVERIPGVEDIIPIYIKESKLVFLGKRPKVGDYMEVHGYFHSKDIYEDGGTRKLEHYVYADKFTFSTTTLPSANEIHLTGKLYRTQISRVVRSGDRVLGFLLKVKRKTHKYSRIPCSVWGIYKTSQIESAKVGSEIELTGRIQSREYIKIEDGQEICKIVYEVSVTDFEIRAV